MADVTTLNAFERFEILPGDFVYFRTHSNSGKVIRALQHKVFGHRWTSEVTHVAFCVGMPEILREELPPKTTFMPARMPLRDREIIAVARPNWVKADQYEILKATILADLLKKEILEEKHWYSIWQVLGLASVTVQSLLLHRPIKRNPIRGGAICTEEALEFKCDLEKVFGVYDPINSKLREFKDSIYPSEFLNAQEDSSYYDIYRNGGVREFAPLKLWCFKVQTQF